MNPKDLVVHDVEFAHHPATLWKQWQKLFEQEQAAFDPIGMIAPIVHAHAAWLLRPQELSEWMARAAQEFIALQVHAGRRLAGIAEDDVILPNADDQRFSDALWTHSAGWDVLKQYYLFLTRNVQDALFQTPGLAPKERRRAAFHPRLAEAPGTYVLE